MGKPFKMKYTNGKKADITTFPFKGSSPQPGDSPAEFNWDAAKKGAGKGAGAGAMMGGPWGAVVGAIGGGALAGFTTEEPKTMEEKIDMAETHHVNEKVEEKTQKAVYKDGVYQARQGLDELTT